MSDQLYDVEFRKAVILLLCKDNVLAQQVLPYIKSSYFPEEVLRFLLNLIKDIYTKYPDKPISFKDLKTEILEKCSTKNEDPDVYVEVLSEIFSLEVNLALIKDKLVDWIKKEEVLNGLNQAVKDLQRGNLEGAKQKIFKAFEVELGQDVGLTFGDPKFFKNLKSRYSKEKLLSTGFEGYDRILMGGFAQGELHVVVAPPKRFKSTFAVNLGLNVIKQGKTVIHITLELSDTDVMLKYYQSIGKKTFVEMISMTDEQFAEQFGKFEALFHNKLFVKHFLPNTITVENIRSYISTLFSEEKIREVDLIIVDYDDLLLPLSKVDDMYAKGGDVYSDLIMLANYYKCPVFTLAQPRRDAWSLDLQGDLIRAEHLAHSAKKAHYAYSISSLNLKSSINSEKEEKRIVLYADMVRRGLSQRKVDLVAYPSVAYITED